MPNNKRTVKSPYADRKLNPTNVLKRKKIEYDIFGNKIISVKKTK